MYRILIIEDDAGIVDAISAQAKIWNIEARGIMDFSNVIHDFVQFQPHVVLLDITLPLYDGYHWCNEIRRISTVPIIFISSANESMNMVMAMNMGADDFIAKPFDQNVLMAKIQALLRRTYDFNETMPLLQCKDLVLNTGDHSATYKNSKISLTNNEYRILLELMKNKGKIVSREKLMQSLWETDEFVDENTLSVNVNRLRKKLEENGIKDLIKTKFGAGYLLESE